jgi:DNA-binding MarR family transcriptional regulator
MAAPDPASDAIGDPASSDELVAVVDAWNEFFASVRRAKGRAARQHGTELTLPQFGILKPLDGTSAGVAIGELADRAEIAAPTASRMIDALEREGMIERQRSETDRRVTTITMTAKGREMFAAKQARIEARRDEMFRSLSAEERDHAARLLRRMAGLMEEL